MNREIKFRAWDKKKGKMIDDFMEFVEDAVRSDKGDPWIYSMFKKMQYTNLKDCNDKRVYEGDVIKLHQIKRPLMVYYSNGGFRLKGKGKFVHHFERLTYIADNKIRFEVIGNIFETPELLEELKHETTN